tara:strand:+ start:2189 stop:2434 length:246 start_codon:yes stop_codon:yes gene_type:complete
MYTCILCDNKDEWTRGLCSKCEIIQDLIKLYSRDKITEALEFVFVRDTEPIHRRVSSLKNYEKKKSKNIIPCIEKKQNPKE